MKKTFVISLAIAAALGMAQASYAAVISDSTGPAAPSLLAAPIVVGFHEEIPPIPLTTAGVNSGDQGITGGTIFQVVKDIHNLTGQSFDQWNIQLQALIGGEWVNSGQGDGVSFGDIELDPTFLSTATLAINGTPIDQAGNWTLNRNVLTDTLSYDFTSFQWNPSDSLVLTFDMSDNAANGAPGSGNTWRLVQYVPEPGSLALLGSGLVAFGAFRRRRRMTE